MEGLDNKDSNNKKNQVDEAKPSVEDSSESDKKSTEAMKPAEEMKPVENKQVVDNKEDEEPTPTEKLYSGTFATPTTTSTYHPTSQPNMLGKLPLVGGLLGGTGAL